MPPAPPLPIDAVLPRLHASLATRNAAVLVAPPGAGKTTRVPLALLDEPWLQDKKIVLLEPRRLAARGAAERMACTLSQAVGQTVGLRVRLGSKVSRATRIEVVTEGVFTRMILDDPELSGIGAVLFDEFHERSLDADLGLALAIDAQSALREDLRLLVMSATLDGARVAALLGDAPVIESQGRAFPVETRHLDRDPSVRIEEAMTEAVLRALRADPGSLLAFLPGQGEIARVAERLAGRLPPDVDLAQLYGALSPAEQDRAIAPARAGRRKVVLATSIAETSLTIEGVRIVVDSGLSRVPVFEPGNGLTRLVTARASRASVDQRRGRAGRTGPGVCWRLWSEAATGALEPFAKPEILAADLAGLLLDCAAWGVTDPAALRFLDPPPAPALAEARALLVRLGGLDGDGRITPMGRALRALPLPPRLARMVLAAAMHGRADAAAALAAVLVERGLGGDSVDLAERLERFGRERGGRAGDMRRLSENWARQARAAVETMAPSDLGDGFPGMLAVVGPGAFLALAYPERVARSRGRDGAFVMVNGRAGRLDEASALARAPYLTIADLAGSAASARILAAAAIEPPVIEALFADAIEETTRVAFDPASRSLRARALRRLGAVTLAEGVLPVPSDDASARILARGIAGLGLACLPWTPALAQWRARVRFLKDAEGGDWPDLSDDSLAATIEDWLAPTIVGRSSLPALTPDDLASALLGLLPWDLRARLEAEAPTHLDVPTGSRIPIDYESGPEPVLAVRVQELFGLDRHPSLGRKQVPVVLHLLSPAQRPIQITRDLPGFWRGSWAAVRAEMRGRYPRHPWPEDPLNEAPTRRAKPRAG